MSVGEGEAGGNSALQQCLALSWSPENHKVGSSVVTRKVFFFLFLSLYSLD